MRTLIFFMINFLAAGLTTLLGQHTENGIENKAFDNTVTKLLSFSVPTKNVDQLRENYNDYIILDAREWEEYEVSHMKDAIHIGYDHLEVQKLDKLDKTKPVLVYCSIGVRSEKIGEKLMEQGFEEVYNLYGSIFEWVNRGYPIYNIDGELTNKIHGYNRIWGVWIKNKEYEKVF